jgi:putative transposase
VKTEAPRKRIKHYDGEGHARELTFSCYDRRPYLSEPKVSDWFIKALVNARKKYPVHIWSYVVMPEHVHLLVWPFEPEFKISKLLESVKTSVAKRYANQLRKQNPSAFKEVDGEFQFWQSGPGYDRNLDNDGTIWASIDYIHLNPVRRSLCDRALDWPWSSARVFNGEPGPVLIDRDSLPPDPRR